MKRATSCRDLEMRAIGFSGPSQNHSAATRTGATLLVNLPFGQTFEPHDLIVIGILVILEGVLSIDNALVLGLLARKLPKRLRPRALSYGLIGAFVFRAMAIIAAGFLLSWR